MKTASLGVKVDNHAGLQAQNDNSSRMTLVLYRTRALCRLRGMSIVSARSIKPSEGSRWRSRRRRVYGDCMWAEEGRG